MLKQIIEFVSKSAPLLATALGSPIAGIIVRLIANVFNADHTSPDDVLSKLASDPDAELKLKTLEAQHEENLEKISADKYKIEVEDKQNARAFGLSLKAWFITSLTVIFLMLYTAILIISVKHPTPQLEIVTNDLQEIVFKIVGYFFGGQSDTSSL